MPIHNGRVGALRRVVRDVSQSVHNRRSARPSRVLRTGRRGAQVIARDNRRSGPIISGEALVGTVCPSQSVHIEVGCDLGRCPACTARCVDRGPPLLLEGPRRCCPGNRSTEAGAASARPRCGSTRARSRRHLFRRCPSRELVCVARPQSAATTMNLSAARTLFSR
jgi:hypothetical protein